jgi:hypothetical protein
MLVAGQTHHGGAGIRPVKQQFAFALALALKWFHHSGIHHVSNECRHKHARHHLMMFHLREFVNYQNY